MTAPDLVEVVANVIADNSVVIHEHSDYGELTASTLTPDEMARAVLDALTEAGTVEWGVQSKTFVDGDWDRVWTKNVNGQPFTEDDARNHLWLKSPIPFRAVSRLTLPWTAVQ